VKSIFSRNAFLRCAVKVHCFQVLCKLKLNWVWQHCDANLELTIPTTVRDVSIPVNSFNRRLKAELFRRAYGTDLAPMWQLSANSLRDHKNPYLRTYLLTSVLFVLNNFRRKCFLEQKDPIPALPIWMNLCQWSQWVQSQQRSGLAGCRRKW